VNEKDFKAGELTGNLRSIFQLFIQLCWKSCRNWEKHGSTSEIIYTRLRPRWSKTDSSKPNAVVTEVWSGECSKAYALAYAFETNSAITAVKNRDCNLFLVAK